MVRVLVVDDTRPLADAVRRGLEAEGFAVDVALNGREGLWRAREGMHDAIVLDIMLPDIDGYAVCTMLRARTGKARTSSISPTKGSSPTWKNAAAEARRNWC